MITEDYVSYEVAKLLKEKGFDIECNHYYFFRKFKEAHYYEKNSEAEYMDEAEHCTAPTHQMAMKWLREIHNIDIDIEAAVGMLGVKVYVPYISTYKPLEGASSKVCQIKRGIHYKDDHWVIPALQHFDSYEEAVETALKYSLENLI